MGVARPRPRVSARLALAALSVVAFGLLSSVATTAESAETRQAGLSPEGPADPGLPNAQVAGATTMISDAPGVESNAGPLSVAGQPQFVTSTTYYSHDFETGPGDEWDDRTTSTGATTTGFLGRFGNQNITLTLTDLPGHFGVNLTWDLLIIDSWDGTSGQDFWGFDIPGVGTPAFEHTFSVFSTADQSFPRPPTAVGQFFGSPSWNENIYRSLSYTAAHTSSTLQVAFYGQGLESIDNESWGIDNVRVSLVQLPPTPVSIEVQPGVSAGGVLSVTVDAGTVSGLHGADYVVTFDPEVLAPAAVTGGHIGPQAFPVDDWNVTSPGTVRVVQTFATGTSASGSGPLARLFFNVTTTVGATTTIELEPSQSALFDQGGQDIPAVWSGTAVTVVDPATARAQVMANAPPLVQVDSVFQASVEIADVTDLNAASYYVTFDPTVLEIVDVTDGDVAGTVVPVGPGEWSEGPPGVVSIVQTLPGLIGATGSGSLSELTFHAIGAQGSR